MVGKRFGRLVIQRFVERRGYNKVYECLCDCGNVRNVFIGNLRRGFTSSCGCLHSEKMKERTTHGMRRTSIYQVWTSMKTRCLNPNCNEFRNYGGRGITICDRWCTSFENFLADMGEAPFDGAEIDRIDNEKGYSPENCHWATKKQNARNKRNSRLLTHEGRTLTVAEWAEVTGLKVSILYKRIYRGLTAEKVLRGGASS